MPLLYSISPGLAAWLQHVDARDWLLVALSPLFLATIALVWRHFRRQDAGSAKPIYGKRDAIASLTLGSTWGWSSAISGSTAPATASAGFGARTWCTMPPNT
jgi:hypothetical protein